MTATWRERTVDVDGPVRVVEHDGRGRHTFVCVHGLGGCSLDWQLLAPMLAERGRVVAMDLPGFGDSPLAGRSATVHAHQRLLHHLLTEVVDGPVVLVGNSLGGVVSLLQAARHPGSVAGLALVSPVLPVSARRPAHPLVAAQFALYATPWLGTWYLRTRRARTPPRLQVDRTLAFIAARTEEIPVAAFEARYALAERMRTRPESERAFLVSARSLLRLVADPVRYGRVLRAVRAPTLVVHGAQDRLVPAAAAQRLARTRPDWAVTVLPGVGHVAQLEVPAEVERLITRWLSQPAAAAASEPA